MITSSCWTRRSVPSRRSTRLGHEPGDDPGLVRHHILVRADSAGATHDFVSGLTEANIEYSIGHPVDAGVREALLLFQEEDWVEALEADGTDRRRRMGGRAHRSHGLVHLG